MTSCRYPGRPARLLGLTGVAAAVMMIAVAVTLAGSPPTQAALQARRADTPATAHLRIASRLTLTVTPNPARTTDTVHLTAGVAEIAGNPFPATGVIAFLGPNGPVGSAPLVMGVASWSGSLPVGSHELVAAYAGDDYYTAALSEAVTVEIDHGESTAQAPTTRPGSVPPMASTGPAGLFAALVWSVAAIVIGLALLLLAARLRR